MNVKNFEDLIAWQKSHQCILEIYKQTLIFPDSEKYGLTKQIRRACVSITSNIAEGCGRYHYKDRKRFYYMARASISEVQNQLILARDLGYLTANSQKQLSLKLDECNKIICGLINTTNYRRFY